MYYICTRITKEMRTFLKNCENSSAGRARPCQGRGRGFEPRFSLKNKIPIIVFTQYNA